MCGNSRAANATVNLREDWPVAEWPRGEEIIVPQRRKLGRGSRNHTGGFSGIGGRLWNSSCGGREVQTTASNSDAPQWRELSAKFAGQAKGYLRPLQRDIVMETRQGSIASPDKVCQLSSPTENDLLEHELSLWQLWLLSTFAGTLQKNTRASLNKTLTNSIS